MEGMASWRAPKDRITGTLTQRDVDAQTDVEPTEVRVGDHERNQVVEKLRSASTEGRITLTEFEDRSARAYQARVLSELLPLLDDLPTEAPVAASVVPVVDGPRSSPWLVSIFGSGRQIGDFRPADLTKAVSVCGINRIDLTQAELVGEETVIKAFALFGSVDVIVPEHIETDMSGPAIFGARSHRSRSQHNPGAQRVVVKAYALFGIVSLRNRRRFKTPSLRSPKTDTQEPKRRFSSPRRLGRGSD
jgi:hypothetical protein